MRRKGGRYSSLRFLSNKNLEEVSVVRPVRARECECLWSPSLRVLYPQSAGDVQARCCTCYLPRLMKIADGFYSEREAASMAVSQVDHVHGCVAS